MPAACAASRPSRCASTGDATTGTSPGGPAPAPSWPRRPDARARPAGPPRPVPNWQDRGQPPPPRARPQPRTPRPGTARGPLRSASADDAEPSCGKAGRRAPAAAAEGKQGRRAGHGRGRLAEIFQVLTGEHDHGASLLCPRSSITSRPTRPRPPAPRFTPAFWIRGSPSASHFGWKGNIPAVASRLQAPTRRRLLIDDLTRDPASDSTTTTPTEFPTLRHSAPQDVA